MNEGTRSGKSTIRLLGISAERPTNGLYLLPFSVMLIVKKRNKNTKNLAYTSLEYGAACWDPYREYQVSALDSAQNKAAKLAHHSGGSDSESGAA
jgi:hypothetical protein